MPPPNPVATKAVQQLRSLLSEGPKPERFRDEDVNLDAPWESRSYMRFTNMNPLVTPPIHQETVHVPMPSGMGTPMDEILHGVPIKIPHAPPFQPDALVTGPPELARAWRTMTDIYPGLRGRVDKVSGGPEEFEDEDQQVAASDVIYGQRPYPDRIGDLSARGLFNERLPNAAHPNLAPRPSSIHINLMGKGWQNDVWPGVLGHEAAHAVGYPDRYRMDRSLYQGVGTAGTVNDMFTNPLAEVAGRNRRFSGDKHPVSGIMQDDMNAALKGLKSSR